MPLYQPALLNLHAGVDSCCAVRCCAGTGARGSDLPGRAACAGKAAHSPAVQVRLRQLVPRQVVCVDAWTKAGRVSVHSQGMRDLGAPLAPAVWSSCCRFCRWGCSSCLGLVGFCVWWSTVGAQQNVCSARAAAVQQPLAVLGCGTGCSRHRVCLPQQQMHSVGSVLSRSKQYRPAVLHVLFCVWCLVTNCGGLVHALWGRLLRRGLFIS